MIEHSMAHVSATLAVSSSLACIIESDAYWGPRIKSVLDAWRASHSSMPVQSIRMLESPGPHRGLGSGTQVACTVAGLLACAAWMIETEKAPNKSDLPNLLAANENRSAMSQLSRLSQRGKRSNIGLCGFLEGGFIWDRGQTCTDDDQSSPQTDRTMRLDFPQDWPVLIIQDSASQGDSGKAESLMFEQCSAKPNPNREAMVQQVVQEILPSIESRDWERFDRAIGQYGRWAGQIFEPAQGGIYRTAQIANTIGIVNQLGIQGATQSSWGPTVCAIARDPDHAVWCQAQLAAHLPNATIQLTSAVNNPAQVIAP